MAYSNVDGWAIIQRGTLEDVLYATEADAVAAADFLSTQTEALPYLSTYVIPVKRIIHTEE